MQPVQDLSVEDRVSRTQYQYTLEDPDPVELSRLVPPLVDQLRTLPELRDVSSDMQNEGLQASLEIDRATASRLGITPQMIDDTLYDAFGQRQVSTIFMQVNQYRVVLEVKPGLSGQPVRSRRDLSPRRERRPGAVERDRAIVRNDGAARHQPPGAVPRGHAFVQHGAGRFTGGSVEGDRRSHGADGAPRKHPGRFPGNGRRLPFLAVQRATADPRGAGDGLHRARGAVRKLIHPVTILSTLPSAGVGALLALLLFRRISTSSADRPHPADRHREEERDHDDRLRPGSRAE